MSRQIRLAATRTPRATSSAQTRRTPGWGVQVAVDLADRLGELGVGALIYVWFDALINYITAPGYGTDEKNFRYWWDDADERVHVIGKGIIRFHAVHWPAMLLSAEVRLPDTIFVHEYLTAGGQKISKSAGNAEDPTDIYGTDAVRWWMLRDVARAGDTDYTAERLVARANEDLANNIGNLVNRTVSMVQRYRQGVIPGLAADNPAGALDAALAELVATCLDIAVHLQPFLPTFAGRIAEQCGNGDTTVADPSPLSSWLGQPLDGESLDGAGQRDGVAAGVRDGTERSAHPLYRGHDGVIALSWGKCQHRAECFGRTVHFASGHPGNRENTAGGCFVSEGTALEGRRVGGQRFQGESFRVARLRCAAPGERLSGVGELGGPEEVAQPAEDVQFVGLHTVPRVGRPGQGDMPFFQPVQRGQCPGLAAGQQHSGGAPAAGRRLRAELGIAHRILPSPGPVGDVCLQAPDPRAETVVPGVVRAGVTRAGLRHRVMGGTEIP